MLAAALPTVLAVEVAGTSWSASFVDYLRSHELGTNGYQIPTGSSQTAAIPWANVNQVRVRFSEDVFVDAADLTLSGINITEYELSDFTYDIDTFEAVWTLVGNLAQDALLVDLDSDGLDPITDLHDNLLDGEWTDTVSTGASGDGTAGGDFEFRVHVNPGDYTRSGMVDFMDYNGVYAKRFTTTSSPNYSIYADINGSGQVDGSDVNLVYANYFHGVPTGNPAGVANDAPSAGPIAALSIYNDTTPVEVSLFDAFEDTEDSDSNLTFALEANSAPSLFDSVSIQAATGKLLVKTESGQMGRATLVVSATDSSGLSTFREFTVDVDRSNAAPALTGNHEYLTNGQYRFYGNVSDADDDLRYHFVVLSGVISARVEILPDLSFSYISEQNIPSGTVTITVEDPQAAAAYYTALVGMG